MKLLLLILPVFLVFSACCTSTADETAGATSPESPEVATAGWESHPGGNWGGFGSSNPQPRVGSSTTAGTEALGPMERKAELESLRMANRRLMEQVTRLMSDVQTLKDPAGPMVPVAPEAISMPAAPVAPVLGVDQVRSSLRGSAAGDLSVGRNSGGEVVITIPGGVCFKSGKADLMAGAQSRLRSVVGALATQYPGLSVRVEGHTDSDPIKRSKWASNEVLSQARAEAVRKFLLGQTPLTADRLQSAGYGASRPVASNDSAQGKALNRRVELVLIP